MNTNILYSTSQSLSDIICETAARMVNLVNLPVALVEYIILPDFGQRIILRFGFANDLKLSFEEADQLEFSLRRLAGTGYWVNLISDSYQSALPDLRQRLISIDQSISSDLLQYSPTRHSVHIRADAHKIRGMLNLPIEALIWEIEVPISESTQAPVIRIIDTHQAGERDSPQRTLEHLKVGGIDCAVVYLQNDSSFAGCVKAYIMAERQHMALNSYIAQFG